MKCPTKSNLDSDDLLHSKILYVELKITKKVLHQNQHHSPVSSLHVVFMSFLDPCLVLALLM